MLARLSVSQSAQFTQCGAEEHSAVYTVWRRGAQRGLHSVAQMSTARFTQCGAEEHFASLGLMREESIASPDHGAAAPKCRVWCLQ